MFLKDSSWFSSHLILNANVNVKQCICFVFQIGSGRLVTVESTPPQLIGRPLAVTDLALRKPSVCEGASKKIKRVKTLDSVKKDLVPVE